MSPFLSQLGLTLPVLAAPMAGGSSTPELVIAAAREGSLGFLAGGYKTPRSLAEQIGAVPLAELITQIRRAVPLPLIAAGGIGTPDEVAAVRTAGAEAAMIGTLLLCADEAGTGEAHRRALADPAFTTTIVTRAFTGRPARGLRNRFTDEYDGIAPAGYPALHHPTSPMRKAASAAGDTGMINLWAGAGYRHARPEPAAQTLTRLAGSL
jgi:nitronate monooxygenase